MIAAHKGRAVADALREVIAGRSIEDAAQHANLPVDELRREWDGYERRHEQPLLAEDWPRQQARAVFRRWLGDTYDLAALDVVLACAAAGQVEFPGDPVWLLLVGGPGNAKTETLAALAGHATITSTIASEGALLSASPVRDRAKDATGGLLAKLGKGKGGLLVIKDFTSILSMSRDSRAAVLAALREVYDGHWERNVGADGGRTLPWKGRIGLIGATTSVYDAAHGVITSMGDRFALLRMDSNGSAVRKAGGLQALNNVGREKAMRRDLIGAVGAVLDAAKKPRLLSKADINTLLPAADLVTLLRTGVERDRQGNVLDAHAPEMPTRFAKQLGQVVRGALAIGVGRADAHQLALRVAYDTVPPLRRLILFDLWRNKDFSTAKAVHERVNKPYTTVNRTLQELQVLGLATKADGGYRMAECLSESPLPDLEDAYRGTAISGNPLPEMAVPPPAHTGRGDATTEPSEQGEGHDRL